MKKLFNSFLLAAMIVLLLTGCGGTFGLTDATVDAVENEGKTFLTIGFTAPGIDNSSVSANASARQINPEPYTNASTFSKFVLTGITENQEVLKDNNGNAGVTLSFTSTTETVALSSSIWYLTLSAYEGTGTNEKLVLWGRRRLDLRTANTASVEFTLSAEGLDTKGGIDLTLNFPDGTDVSLLDSAKVFLYSTNESVLWTGEGNDRTEGVAATLSSTKLSTTYSNTAIAPGTYQLMVKYYTSAANGSKVLGVWGDVIVIASGRTTTDTISIPDILAKKPAAPSNFHAYRVTNSEDAVGEHYDVLFTWDRGALKNEENFVISLYSYDKDATNATRTLEKVYGVEASSVETDKKEIFFESADRVSGSLNACSTSCIIRLKTGTLYEASIKAQNTLGDSADPNAEDGFDGVVRSAATANATAPANSPAYPENTYYGEERINLVKITYMLNGGTLVKDGFTYTGTYRGYNVYTGSAIPLLASADYTSLSKDAVHTFSGWFATNPTGNVSTGFINPSEYNPAAAFANKVVYAGYDFSMTSITYTVNDSYGTIAGSAAATVTGTDTATWTAASKTLEIVSTANPNITFTATNPTGDTTNIIAIKYNISELGLSNEAEVTTPATTANITFSDTARLASGKTYAVILTVVKADNKIYGDTIYVSIVR